MNYLVIIDMLQARPVKVSLFDHGIDFRENHPVRGKSYKDYFIVFDTEREELLEAMEDAGVRRSQYTMTELP